MAGELGLRALGAGADALGFDNAGKSLKDTADDLGQTFSQSAEAVGQTGGAGTTRIIGRGLKNFVTGQAAANQKLARGINNVLADTADFYGADRARDFFRENSNLASSAINKIENFGDNDMKGWQAAGEIADATALAPAMLGHSAKAARLAKALGASEKVATRIGNAAGSAANGAIMGGFTGGARAYGQEKPDLKQAGLESTIWGGANAILGGLSRAPILAKGVLGKASEQTQKAAQGLDYQNLREGVPTPAGTTAPQTRADGELLSPPLSSDQSARLNRYSDTSRTMAAADNAGSVTDNTIIPQSSVAEGILNNPNLFGLDENVIKAIRSELEEAAGIAPKKMSEAAKGADKAETVAQAPNPFLDEILRATNPANNNAYLDQILAITNPKAIQKEKRGIYNVAYNGKNSTSVYPDIDFVENAVKLEQGSKKRGGIAHIQKHFEKDAKGYVTPAEMTQIGDRMREYTAKFKKPYIDADGGRLYEWQDKDGVKFRVVVYDGGVGSTTHITTTPVNDKIISFYSDRNLKKPMEFKTPALREADEAIRGGDTLSSLGTPQAMRNQGLDTATDIIPQNGENMIKGFSSSAIPANIASAGAGAATGAALDDKNRARGAFIGALGGLGLVNAPALVSKLKGGAKVGEIAQDIEAAAKDKPSILSNMRSYLKAVGANSASELRDLSGKDIGLSYARQMASEHINKEFKNIAYEILSGSQSLAQNLKNGAINAARFARRALSETKGADYLLRNDELFSAKSAYSAKMENLQSALSGLDDADRVAMHEYMVGEGNAIKPELKPLADALRRQIDDMSAKLVDLGVLDKASRDALAGQYLARSYEKHLKDRINSVFSSGKKVDEIHSRGFAFKEFKDREAMDKFLSKNPQIAKSMDQAYNKGGVRVVEKPNGKIELWRDYTKDERSAMGEKKRLALFISFTSHSSQPNGTHPASIWSLTFASHVVVSASFMIGFLPTPCFMLISLSPSIVTARAPLCLPTRSKN